LRSKTSPLLPYISLLLLLLLMMMI